MDVSLGIGFLHQSAPELIVVIGVAVHQLSVHRRKPVINHHVYPLTEPPELEVKDSGVRVGVFFVPLLVLPVWNYLSE